MSEQPKRWSKAQEEPGQVEYSWWSLIDNAHAMVRGRLYSASLAQAVVDGLNTGAPILDQVRASNDREVLQTLVDEIDGSAPRDCGHQNTGDGSAVLTCATCVAWLQAQSDIMAIRRHMGLD